MIPNRDLRAVMRVELGVDDARIDQLFAAGRRVGSADGDTLGTVWLATRDPNHYAGQRGPKPRDPLLRAIQIEAERQAAMAADWDSCTPAAIEAAELLAQAMSVGCARARQKGTRPQTERRATARRARAITAGQASFAGFGWGAQT